jgi:hypothetical protein
LPTQDAKPHGTAALHHGKNQQKSAPLRFFLPLIFADFSRGNSSSLG